MKRTRIASKSPARIALDYPSFVVAVLTEHGHRCQVGPIIATVDPLWFGCRGRATELHHLRKRSSAGALVCRANVLTSCNPCNAGWVEDEPDLAHLAGLVIRPGDDRWLDLGKRHHRDHHEGTD